MTVGALDERALLNDQAKRNRHGRHLPDGPREGRGPRSWPLAPHLALVYEVTPFNGTCGLSGNPLVPLDFTHPPISASTTLPIRPQASAPSLALNIEGPL